MKFLFTTILIFTGLIYYGQQPNLEWAKSWGGPENDFSEALTIDNQGNIYVTGSFIDTVDFDPSTNVLNLISASNNNPDISIHKLDTNGNLIWAKSIGDVGADYGREITLDNQGNVYVTGDFTGTVDFDPDSGVFNLTSTSGSDIFVVKLDSNGGFVWAKGVVEGAFSKNVYGIDIDLSGNIYIGGIFYQTADFNPSANVFNITSNGSADCFVQKLDSNGDFKWAKSFGGTGYDFLQSLVVDNNNNVLSTGAFKDTVDFDPSTGVVNHISNGGNDIFLQKLDSNGDLVWAKTTGGSGSDVGTTLTIGGVSNIYLGGKFSDTVDFDFGSAVINKTSNGSADYFIQKLDVNCNLIWVKCIGGVGNDEVNSLVCDFDENIYVLGSFNDTVDFDPSMSDTVITTNGLNDVSIQKIDSIGNLWWVKTYGGVGYDNGRSVVIDQNGSAYLTGTFPDTISLDAPISPIYSNGGNDGFMIKLSPVQLTSVSEKEWLSDLNLYPNPTNGQFNIDLGTVFKQSNIQIIDISGRIVYQEVIKNKKLVNLNLDAPQGIYFVRINAGENQSTIKLIKQ